jgi:hypothetical protein
MGLRSLAFRRRKDTQEAASQNGEQAAVKVKLEGEALRDAIKKQVWPFVLHKPFLSVV